MDVSPSVLYQGLLQDLSRHLPAGTINSLRVGEPVESWPDITVRQRACLSLANSFLKKYVEETVATADASALSKFLAINDDCKNWQLPLELTSWDDELIGNVKKHIERFFYPRGDLPLLSSFGQILSVGRCGPGSSIGSEGGDFYTKMFSSKLTYSNGVLYRAYRNHILHDPTWANAELLRHVHYGSDNMVEGNRLSFVPKQRDISRVTCVEPTLNMYFQLGIGSILEQRLKSYFGIDLSTQPHVNRELARIGSLDGSLFTIDLSSASDSMSLKMLRYLLPANVLSWLELTRSPKCTLPSGEQVEMNMISTMGNGFTFPLQTMLFSCVVLASFDSCGLEIHSNRRGSLPNFGVFGDDIIGDSRVLSRVLRLLKLLGFVVNASKSFSEGPFRESCGGDFFRGHQVRGVYVRRLASVQDRAVVLNRLHHWSSVTGVYVSTCTSLLWRSLPKRFVPLWENDDAGIKVPFTFVEKMRRNKSLQSIMYRKWISVPRRINIRGWESLYAKKRIYNCYGLHLAFLAGTIRSEAIVSRQETVTYTTKTKVAPSWDQPRMLLVTETSWRQLNTAVWLTLSG